MSEFKHAVEIDAPADQVFDFVSNPENMPRFLPTVSEAHSDQGDRVVMLGSAHAHPYTVEGEVHLDPDERTMHWTSAAKQDYRGELAVVRQENGCTLAVSLSFQTDGSAERNIVEHESAGRGAIQDALETTLERIKQACESQEPASVEGARGYLG